MNKRGDDLFWKSFVLFITSFLILSVLPYGAYADEVAFDQSKYTLQFEPHTGFGKFFAGFQDIFITGHEQANFDVEQAARYMADAHAYIGAGDMSKALSSAEDAKRRLEHAASQTESADVSKVDDTGVKQGEGVLEHPEVAQLTETLDHTIQLEAYQKYLASYLNSKVDEGNVEKSDAEILKSSITSGSAELVQAAEEKTGEAIDSIAENSGISGVEAELLVQEVHDSTGLSEGFKQETAHENLDEVSDSILKLEGEVASLRQEDKQEEAQQLETLLGQAELRLAQATDAADLGNHGEAYGQLNAAEHLIANCERAVTDYRGGNQGAFRPLTEFTQSPEEIQQWMNKMNEHFAGDEWKQFKDKIIAENPEKAEYFASREEQAGKVAELALKLSENYREDFDKLISEGKSQDEATAVLTQKFSDSYAEVYGQAYVPPGLINYYEPKEGEEEHSIDDGSVWPPAGVDVVSIGRIDKDFFERENEKKKDKTTGDDTIVAFHSPFIKNYEYKDPVTGYSYKFDEKGYTYTNDLGVSYDVEFPEEFTPQSIYKTGDEQYETKVYTDTGEVTYKYFPTGYEVNEAKDEANKEKSAETGTASEDKLVEVAYPTGTHEIVGGGEIQNNPTGFSVESKTGILTQYDYDPRYQSYVDPVTGKVYSPEVSVHEQYSRYNANEGKYEYYYAGETWKYQGPGQWQSNDGRSYQGGALNAPIGHEEQKSYTSGDGVGWEFSSGQWKSSKGEVYNPPVNHYYRYDSARGYVNDKGEIISGGSETGSSAGSRGVTDYSGKTWKQNTEGKWVASTGETWDSKTGTYSGNAITGDSASGSAGTGTGTTGQYNYGRYYDSSGNEHSTSYSGGSYVKAETGGYVYVPSTAGNSVEGYKSNDYSSGKVTDNYGNTWSQKSDGSWSNEGGGSGAGATYNYNSPSSSPTPSGTYSSGTYTGASGYTAPSGSYSGGSYSGESHSGATGSYSGGSYSGGGGSYSGSSSYSGGSGSYSSGSYSSGTTSGSSSGSTSSGSSGGGDSGGSSDGSSGGGSSGGSSGGGSSSGSSGGGGGGGTGMVISGSVVADHEQTQSILKQWLAGNVVDSFNPSPSGLPRQETGASGGGSSGSGNQQVQQNQPASAGVQQQASANPSNTGSNQVQKPRLGERTNPFLRLRNFFFKRR